MFSTFKGDHANNVVLQLKIIQYIFIYILIKNITDLLMDYSIALFQKSNKFYSIYYVYIKLRQHTMHCVLNNSQ